MTDPETITNYIERARKVCDSPELKAIEELAERLLEIDKDFPEINAVQDCLARVAAILNGDQI